MLHVQFTVELAHVYTCLQAYRHDCVSYREVQDGSSTIRVTLLSLIGGQLLLVFST